MRRAVVLLAALSAALLIPSPSPAATVTMATQTQFNGNYYLSPSLGNSVYFGIFMANQYEERDLVSGNVIASFSNACVSVSRVVNNVATYDSGCGPLTLEFDPLLLQGTVKGTVVSQQGTILVNVSYLLSRVDTTVPYISLDAVPTPPQSAQLDMNINRFGRVSGSVSSSSQAVGTVSGSNGSAYASRYTWIRAAP